MDISRDHTHVRLLPWLFLAMAVVTEVIGTSFMAMASRNGEFYGYIVMGGAIALSYYLMAQALNGISIGVAYAVWEGLGVGLLTLIAVFILGEVISLQKILGLTLSVAGIVCVTMGEGDQQ